MAGLDAKPLVVIGCGNLNRSDDAVGVRVVQRLKEEFAHEPACDLRLFDAGTGGMDVMFKARGTRELIIVDACSSGSDPGAIFRLPGSEIDTAHEPAYSLHDFRWDHAVHAGRRIFGDDFPTALTVYLVEAGSLELGLDLTPAVAAAVDRVCEHITRQIHASRYPRTDRGMSHTVCVGGGRVLVPVDTYDTYLGDAGAAALLARDGQVYLMPLNGPVAGGSLLKQKNLRGDRVMVAGDFLSDQGIDPFEAEQDYTVRWISEAGALLIEGFGSRRSSAG